MDRLIEVAQNTDRAEKLFAPLDGMGIGQQRVVRDQRQDGLRVMAAGRRRFPRLGGRRRSHATGAEPPRARPTAF